MPQTRWPTVFLALTGGIIAAAHFGKMPPSLPMLRADLGLSLVQGGWAVSIFSLIGLVFGILAGTLSDSLGARRVLALGLAFLALGSVAGSLSSSESMLLASRALEGVGFLLAATSGGALIAQSSSPNDLKRSLGLWSTYMPAGSALMILTAPLFLENVGWRGLFQMIALLSFIWVFLLLRNSRPAKTSRTSWRQLPGNLKTVIAAPGPVVLSLSFAFYTFQWVTLMVWLPSAMIETEGLSPAFTALLTAVIVAANIIGNLGAGWLQHKGLPRSVILAGGAILMAVSAQGIFSETLPGLARFILCLVFSAAGGILPGVILSGAPAVSPRADAIGATNGLMVQGSHLGQMIGPPVIAAVVSASGTWGSSVWAMNGAAAAIVLLALICRRFID